MKTPNSKLGHWQRLVAEYAGEVDGNRRTILMTQICAMAPSMIVFIQRLLRELETLDATIASLTRPSADEIATARAEYPLCLAAAKRKIRKT